MKGFISKEGLNQTVIFFFYSENVVLSVSTSRFVFVHSWLTLRVGGAAV